MELTIIYTDKGIENIFEDVYTVRQGIESIIVFHEISANAKVYTNSRVISESVSNCYLIFEALNIDTTKLDDYIMETYYG